MMYAVIVRDCYETVYRVETECLETARQWYAAEKSLAPHGYMPTTVELVMVLESSTPAIDPPEFRPPVVPGPTEKRGGFKRKAGFHHGYEVKGTGIKSHNVKGMMRRRLNKADRRAGKDACRVS